MLLALDWFMYTLKQINSPSIWKHVAFRHVQKHIKYSVMTKILLKMVSLPSFKNLEKLLESYILSSLIGKFWIHESQALHPTHSHSVCQDG